MKKNDLRDYYLSKRMKQTEKEYNKKNETITNFFLGRFIISKNTFIHIYLSKNEDKEVDTWTIIKELENKKANISIPKIIKNNKLKNCILHRNIILKKNKWNIKEPINCQILDPEKLEIIVLPALICDIRGYRVGYGGGYYDRFLKDCSKEIIKIALCFFEPIKKIENINQYDIPMNFCITPNKIIEFKIGSNFQK